MRSRGGRFVVSLVTAVAFLLASTPGGGGALLAQEGEAAITIRYSQSLSVKPGTLSGQVLYPDGKTPAANLPVRVWDVTQKKFLYEGMTDEKGNYKLPTLAPGRYVLVFGDRVRVELTVADAASFAGGPLNVIIPRGRVFFAPGELEAELTGEGAAGMGAEGAAAGGGKLLPTLLILGATGVTAVAVVALLGGFGGGEGRKGVVSP